jgi:hypothetical protein
MAPSRKRYRISRFGTVVLPDEIKEALWCIMKLEIIATRGIAYYSEERIPRQTVHGWIVARDADGFVNGDDWDWRFDKQRWTLWTEENTVVSLNQCFIGNTMLEVIMEELAKKPNIPPIPPSIPFQSENGFFGKVPLIVHGYESISVKTRVNADFDIEFVYEKRPESRCSPKAEEFPRGPAPIENELPKPGGSNGVAPGPVFPPASLPVSAPPIGGTSIIPEGYQSSDQSSPGIPEPPIGAYRVTVGQQSFRSVGDQCVPDFQQQIVRTVNPGPASLRLSVNPLGGPKTELVDRNGATNITLLDETRPVACSAQFTILSQVLL